MSQVSDRILKATELLTGLCETREEMLTVLLHLVVAGLAEEIRAKGLKPPADEQYVVSYLVRITKMLDAGEGSKKQWLAMGEPVDPEVERAVREMLTRDGSTVIDLGDAGRNDPCPCGSGKKYKRCHGAG
jgi:hypothetical protein